MTRRVSAIAGLVALLLAGGAWLITTQTGEAQSSRARVVLDIVDSDDVVAPGDDVDVHVFVRRPVTGKTYCLDFFHTVGGAIEIGRETLTGADVPEPPSTSTHEYIETVNLHVPLGSKHGRSTLSALIYEIDNADCANRTNPLMLPLGQITLTIADAGTPVASARISSTFKDCKTSGTRSSTSLRRTEEAYLKLEVKNSRGHVTDDWHVKTIIITATGATITRCSDRSSNDHFIRYDDAYAVTAFYIEPIDPRPLHFDVVAHAIGEDGSVRSNTLVVNFAGQASGITVGEPGGTLAARHGRVRIPVSGLDSDGNRDDLSTGLIQAEVTEGPEDADLNLLRIAKSKCTSSQRDCETGDVILLVTTPTSDTSEAEHGDYVIEVQLTTDPEEVIHEVTVHVVGEAVEMTFELLNGADPDVRRIFTSTGRADYEFGSGETNQMVVGTAQFIYAAVTMRDEDGALISQTSSTVSGDGVRFQIVGGLKISRFSSREVEVIDGVAYTRFLVAGDEGAAVMVATSRDLEGVVSMVGRGSSRFGADGLIKVEPNDYTTWTATNRIRVSQIFPDLAKQGISTVFLWVAESRTWLRYSPIGGTLGRGSSDFEIGYGDTLYLSKPQ